MLTNKDLKIRTLIKDSNLSLQNFRFKYKDASESNVSGHKLFFHKNKKIQKDAKSKSISNSNHQVNLINLRQEQICNGLCITVTVFL